MVYVTKFLFRDGIVATQRLPDYVHESSKGTDWHETEADAFVYAEKERVKKIASLEKALKRTRDLRFKVTHEKVSHGSV